jgi:integrase
MNGGPHERINQETLRRYVEELAARITPMSVAAELGHLILALAALAPTLDLSWLRAWQARWQRDAQPREKRSRIVHGGRLLVLGLKLMDQASDEATPAEQSRSYRDGFLIALLATVPLRRRTLAGLRIDRNLFAVGTGYVLAVAHAETKSGQPLEYPLPKRLAPYVTRYLEQYRLMFAGAARHPHLWPSARGGALGAEAIYELVCRRTKVAFGVAIYPHLFRTIVATTLARDAPNQLLTARDLLGHANLMTTDRHYRQSQTIEASRQHARLLERLVAKK